MAQLAVTAIGADQPGIIAAVAEVLRDEGGNLEDSAMTILGGHFAIVLLVDIEAAPDELEKALADATADLGLTVSVTPTGPGHEAADPTHVLSVYGADRPGILAGIARTLADVGANVTDLQTRLLSAAEDPVYAIVLEASVPDEEELTAALAEVCPELGVDHTLRPLETREY